MRAALAGFGLVLCVVADTGADTTILRPRPPGTAPLRGIARAAAFDVDPARLARLRAATAHRLDGFPVGDQRRTLELERFDPLGAARLQVVGPGGVRSVPPPDLVFFRGRVAGEPDSLAVVTAGATTLRALILASGGASVVGRDASGVHRAWSLADVDPTVHAPPAAFCMNDLVDLGRPAPDGAARASALTTTAPSHLGLRRAAVALETDQELRAKFASTSDALAYVASLFAEASAVYERDVDLALDLSFLRIWDTTDPWVSAVPDGQLAELRGYWNDPANGMAAAAGPRAVVHMLSGKPVLGGIAYVDAACLAAWGYGVSQVFGSFDLDNPNGIWDLAVVMHELGHNFGTEHTHCYVPPIDTCYNGEPGCWDGAVTSSRGTVMSYCHQHAGGLANLDLRFHDRVRDLLHTTTAAAECLVLDGSSPCGNGVLDDGEECDDGNRSAGDGCSASCRLEVCGNGFLDPGEECDDGNTVAGDGCSPTCGLERCGDGEIQDGEECDDGNLVAGDGCSATCHLERCALRLPHQSVWAAARLLVSPAPRDGLALRAVFEIPADATITLLEHGLTVLGETDAGDAVLDVTVPGGDGWRQRGTRMRYRDAAGPADGVRKVIVKTKTHGERTRVRFLLVGRGGGYPASLAAMPARLTVVLGGAEAGSAGACGEWQPGLGSCRSERGGKRLVCR